MSIKTTLKSLLTSILGKGNTRKLLRKIQAWTTGFKQISYAQEGEDMILKRIYENQSSGFFVDIGAHHPQRFSNTYLLYQKGWRGINIDPTPGSMQVFEKIRPDDINLEMGIGSETGEIEFYMFDEPALNSFDKELSLQRARDTDYEIIRTQKVAIYQLEDILNKYLPAGQKIDFITIDAEGLDEIILQSNNWKKHRPQYVLIELYDWNPQHATQIYMESIGYAFYAKTVNTVFFRNSEKA